MKDFEVTITAHLSKTVVIEAVDEREAERTAREGFNSGDFRDWDDHFVGADFEVVELVAVHV